MGTLGSPGVLFPMGDASVPTPLRPSPAPTNVTICSKKPTVESSSPAPTGLVYAPTGCTPIRGLCCLFSIPLASTCTLPIRLRAAVARRGNGRRVFAMRCARACGR